MLKNEFDGISEEEMEDFKAIVVQFYGKPWGEAYPLLTKEITDRLRRKDTNRSYRAPLINDVEDLVMSVVARLIKINGKLRRAGNEILNFQAMLENRIGHVYHEELRRLLRAARAVEIDRIDVVSPTALIDREMEDGETRAIKAECHQRCLDELPEHVLEIFLEYYDVGGLTPAARTEARRRLALRVAGIAPSAATPEAAAAAKRNLDSMLSKWRRNTLARCNDKCLKERHLR